VKKVDHYHIVLTEKENLILNSYKTLVDGLADYLGSGYEIILHSLEDLDKSVIKIVNGHYSGRSEGAPITDFALSMLETLKKNNDKKSISYFNRDKNGIMMKSTTIPIIGEYDRIIGMLCINFYTNLPLSEVLAKFIPNDSNLNVAETFSDNVDELIISALEEAKSKVLSNPNIPVSNKNKEIISLLSEKGIFNLKDAVVKVASYMGISKNTVYMHLRNIS
jgi:predicted transcriptional regulator YheO